MIRAMLLAAVALCLLSTACESPRPQRRSPGAGASILSHLSYLGVACHAPCGLRQWPFACFPHGSSWRCVPCSLRPWPFASAPRECHVLAAAVAPRLLSTACESGSPSGSPPRRLRGSTPWGSAIPRGCALRRSPGFPSSLLLPAAFPGQIAHLEAANLHRACTHV